MSIALQSADEAYNAVLLSAGASVSRDEVDARIIEEVKLGKTTYGAKGDGIIDSQKDVGSWPELTTEEKRVDQDQDGMDDAWEKKRKLNPSDPQDANGHDLHPQYTNIEMYLNGLLE